MRTYILFHCSQQAHFESVHIHNNGQSATNNSMVTAHCSFNQWVIKMFLICVLLVVWNQINTQNQYAVCIINALRPFRHVYNGLNAYISQFWIVQESFLRFNNMNTPKKHYDRVRSCRMYFGLLWQLPTERLIQ